MEKERVLLDYILELRKKTFCRKFVGALTIELLKKEFAEFGLNVSNRDVFVEGVPNELDLLIAKKDAHAEANLVYNSDDVLAVLEVKFRGSYGKKNIDRIKAVFDSAIAANKNIECFYLTVSENSRYKHRATRAKLGYDCFELLTRDTNLESALKKDRIKETGEWQKLLERLKILRV